MKIIEKFIKKQVKYSSDRTPTIAFFGDSVTHGCFYVYVKNNIMETYVDTKSGYPEKVRYIFNTLYPDIPINIINSGISGDNATNGFKNRLERDVLSFNPDLVVVCFGLNDSMQGEKGLDEYKSSMSGIFKSVKEQGAEVILLTPNLMTDKVEIPFGDELLDSSLKSVIARVKEGWPARYINEAKKEAKLQNIPICDCNRIWENLVKNGVNVNNLLSNRINHPTKDMHWLFAYELVRTIFDN